MPIAFPAIPLPFLPPLYYADIVPGQTPYSNTLKCLLIGAAMTTVDAPPNVPTLLSGTAASELYGEGSMLRLMYARARANAPFAEFWGMALDPDPGATVAKGLITVTKTAPKTAPLYIRIAGQPFSVPIRKGDEAPLLAQRIRAVLNGHKSLPVFAGPREGYPNDIIIYCRWKGNTGNEIRIEKNWFGLASNFSSMIDITQMGEFEEGLGGYLEAPALAAIGKQRFDVFACKQGFVSDNGIEDFLDGMAGRWAPNQQLYGHFVTARNGSLSGLVTYGGTTNDPHHTTMGIRYSPSPTWEWAAAIAAHMTQHWSAPPELSRPLQTLRLRDILGPNDLTLSFDSAEENSLLSAGISTYMLNDSNEVLLGRLVTHRTTNDWGDPDGAWRDAVTMFQSQYFARRLRAAVTSVYPRAALTDKESGIPGFASPQSIADLYVHEYKAMEREGLVENSDIFEASLIVERNQDDPNRIDSLIKPDFVNQLRIVANLIETYLETSSQNA